MNFPPTAVVASHAIKGSSRVCGKVHLKRMSMWREHLVSGSLEAKARGAMLIISTVVPIFLPSATVKPRPLVAPRGPSWPRIHRLVVQKKNPR